MIKTAPTNTIPVMAIINTPMNGSMEKAISTPMTHIMGTGKIIWMLQTKACCTMFTSLRVRVIMEPVPNCSKS